MSDYLDNFASTQHLLDLARQQGMPASGSNAGTPYQAMPMDDYMPPVVPVQRPNVIALVPHKPVQQEQPVQGDPNELLGELTDIIREKESSDNYTAMNPHSSASGAYQYTDSTWNNFMGYPKAALAPKAVQDKRFAMDIAKRYAKFAGNPYQVIAAHYLPALADDPSKWFTPFKVHGKVVKPVIDYVRYVVNGTPLEKGLHEYIAQQ